MTLVKGPSDPKYDFEVQQLIGTSNLSSYIAYMDDKDSISNIYCLSQPHDIPAICQKSNFVLPEDALYFHILNVENVKIKPILYLLSEIPKNKVVFCVDKKNRSTLYNGLNFEQRGLRFEKESETFFLYVYNFEKNFNDLMFGIEFETCVCDTFDMSEIEKFYKNLSLENPKHVQADYTFQAYVVMLKNLSLQNGYSDVNFIDSSGHDIDYKSLEESYTSYIATIDNSIECNPLDEPASSTKIYKKRDTFTAKNCHLKSVELVTPKISCNPKDYDQFVFIFENVIKNENFLYESNDTQGMHVNVSHPLQNVEQLLSLWWFFEPIILLFLPKNRRNSSYAKPLRKRFASLPILIQDWKKIYYQNEEKYLAVRVHKNRFEFRIVPAGMDREHVLNWLNFCLKFVFASISKPIITDDDDQFLGKDKFNLLFDYYIQDVDLKYYFSEKLTLALSEPVIINKKLLFHTATEYMTYAFLFPQLKLDFANVNMLMFDEGNYSLLPKVIKHFPKIDWKKSFEEYSLSSDYLEDVVRAFYLNQRYKQFFLEHILSLYVDDVPQVLSLERAIFLLKFKDVKEIDFDNVQQISMSFGNENFSLKKLMTVYRHVDWKETIINWISACNRYNARNLFQIMKDAFVTKEEIDFLVNEIFPQFLSTLVTVTLLEKLLILKDHFSELQIETIKQIDFQMNPFPSQITLEHLNYLLTVDWLSSLQTVYPNIHTFKTMKKIMYTHPIYKQLFLKFLQQHVHVQKIMDFQAMIFIAQILPDVKEIDLGLIEKFIFPDSPMDEHTFLKYKINLVAIIEERKLFRNLDVVESLKTFYPRTLYDLKISKDYALNEILKKENFKYFTLKDILLEYSLMDFLEIILPFVNIIPSSRLNTIFTIHNINFPYERTLPQGHVESLKRFIDAYISEHGGHNNNSFILNLAIVANYEDVVKSFLPVPQQTQKRHKTSFVYLRDEYPEVIYSIDNLQILKWTSPLDLQDTKFKEYIQTFKSRFREDEEAVLKLTLEMQPCTPEMMQDIEIFFKKDKAYL